MRPLLLSPLAAAAIQLSLLVGGTVLLLTGPRSIRWLRVVLLGLAWLLLDAVAEPIVVSDQGLLADVPVVPAVAVSLLLAAFVAAGHELRTGSSAVGWATAGAAVLAGGLLVLPEPAALGLAVAVWVAGTGHLGWVFRRSARAHPGSLLEARLRVLSFAMWLLAAVAASVLGGPFVVVWLLPMVVGTAVLVLAVAPPPFLQLVVARTRSALRRADRELASIGTDREGLREAIAAVCSVFGATAAVLEDEGTVVAAVGEDVAVEGARQWLVSTERPDPVSRADDVGRLRWLGDGRFALVGDTGRGRLVVVLGDVGVLLSPVDREQVEGFAERIGLALTRADARRADQLASSSMRAAERMRDDMLSTLSHELRTPLTSIMGFSEVLRSQSEALSSGQRSDMLGRIVDKTRKLERIVAALLDLTAIRGRNEPDRIATYDVRDLAERALVRVRDVAGDRVVELDGAAGTITSDGGAVLSILEQLLENACKFTPDGTTVRVELEGDDTTVRVTVRDRGEGLPMPDHEAFEPFVRGGDLLTRETGGVGIGLTIARELARQLAGELVVVPTGIGTAIRLTVPREHPLATHHHEPTPRPAVAAAQDPTLERA